MTNLFVFVNKYKKIDELYGTYFLGLPLKNNEKSLENGENRFIWLDIVVLFLFFRKVEGNK